MSELETVQIPESGDETISVDLGPEDDLQIEVIDDRPEEDRVEPRDESRNASNDNDFDNELTDQEINAIGEGATKRIKRLRYEYHEERRAKEEADRMREEALQFAQHQQQENANLRALLDRGKEALLSEVRSRTESDMEAARAYYRKAVEEGDPDEILKAQEALNNSQITKFQAINYADVEPAPIQNGQVPVNPAQQYQPQPGMAEVVQPPPGTVDPRLEKWKSENYWFGLDKPMTKIALDIHEDLIKKDGISPYSEEYYNRLDSRLREREPKFFGVDESNKGNLEPAARTVPSVVANPSRSGTGSPNKVQLTKTAAAVAERLGISQKAYAKEILAMNRNKNNG